MACFMTSFDFRILVFFAAVGLATWWFTRSKSVPEAVAKKDAVRAWVDDFLVKQQQK